MRNMGQVKSKITVPNFRKADLQPFRVIVGPVEDCPQGQRGGTELAGL